MDYQKKEILTDELTICNIYADYEHKKIVEIFNDLIELIECKKDRKELAKVLTKMTDFSLTHFKQEEKYLRKLSSPKLAELKSSQRNYIFKVAMYNVDLLSDNPPHPKEIIEFIEKWWLNHILTHNKS